ncbi:hypothetical protein TNCV_3915901 [Trichonephila clavipes]|nr:hypothetical protein TNCV_3915901 [Trichonephila clavipes]
MSTKEREINPSKRKAKKSKSSGRNANKTSYSDENQTLSKEKNGLLTTFWIFFRCGQLIFRMADCEVEDAIASPRGIPQRGQCPRRGKGAAIEGTSEPGRIRGDRKGRDARAFKNESQLGNDV